MLALQNCNGLQVLEADELYFINGGSGSSTSISFTGSYASPVSWSATITIEGPKNTYEGTISCSMEPGYPQITIKVSKTPN